MSLPKVVEQLAQTSRAGGPRQTQRQSIDRRRLANAQRQSRRQFREQDVLNRLRSVNVPMAPGIRVLDPLPGMESAAAADPANTVIYSRGAMDRNTASHESAHLLEKFMTDRDKRRFSRVMGRPDAPWEVGTAPVYGETHESTGYRGSMAERFASMTALLATRHDPQSNHVISDYMDKMPSRKELLRFGRALERFGARNNLQSYERPRR